MDATATDAPGGHVVVVGGGLAGLAAAERLASRGHRTTLVEERSFAGGRACSYLDRESGLEIDNGQHVFMRCCTGYLAFLDRIGMSRHVHLQGRLAVPVTANGTWSTIRSAPLPSPLHLLPSIFAYRHLSPADRLCLLRAALALLSPFPLGKGAGGLGSLSFHHWLAKRGQSPEAIEYFWDLICLATMNVRARSASAEQALMVLQVGFLSSPRGADIGTVDVGLGTIAAKAVRHLEDNGADVLLGRGVESLVVDGTRVTDVALRDGSRMPVEQCVCAVPPDRLLEMLPGEWADHPDFRAASTLRFSPIANVHLWYDRPVMDRPFAASLRTRAHWIFDKGAMMGEPELKGCYLLVTVGEAMLGGQPVKELVRQVSNEIASIFPAAGVARLDRSKVTLEPRATFIAAPESVSGRLPAATPFDNLWLAGDWTRTGWPATMEGAVRSGGAAADHASAALLV